MDDADGDDAIDMAPEVAVAPEYVIIQWKIRSDGNSYIYCF